MVIAQTSLWYYGGTSDKVYVVTARENVFGNWIVVAEWGRRGKTMQSQIKGEFATRGSAMATFNEVVRSKTVKGYQRTGSAMVG